MNAASPQHSPRSGLRPVVRVLRWTGATCVLVAFVVLAIEWCGPPPRSGSLAFLLGLVGVLVFLVGEALRLAAPFLDPPDEP